MSEPELEDLIRASFAESEDRAFDRRVLDAAGELLDARAATPMPAVASASTSRRRFWIAAAAVFAASLCLWYWVERVAQPTLVELRLQRGSIALDAAAAPLELTTPLGRVSLATGRARVDLIDAETSVEERETMRAKFAVSAALTAAALWMGVEVFEGVAQVEANGQVVRVGAGEAHAFLAEPQLAGALVLSAAPTSDGQVDRRDQRSSDRSGTGADKPGRQRKVVVRDTSGRLLAGAEIRALDPDQRVQAATFRQLTHECHWVSAAVDTALALELPALVAANVAAPNAVLSSGEYTLPSLREEAGAVLIQVAGFAPTVVFSVAAESAEPLEVVMREAVTLDLELVDELGCPLAGFSSNDPFACGESERTSVRLLLPLGDGSEAVIPMEHLGAGRFRLRTAATASANLEVAWAGVPTTKLALSFDATTTMPMRLTVPAGSYVAGRVMRESGEPFAGASVHLESFAPNGRRRMHSSLSDRAGWFRIASHARVKRVRVQADGFAALERHNLRAPDGSLEFVLQPLVGAVLAGRIQDEAGLPLAGEELRLIGADFLFNGHNAQTSDEQGRFRFENLQAGRYEVRWDRPRPFIPVTLPELVLHAGEIRTDLVVAPPPGGRIIVHCCDRAGAPLQAGHVELNRQRLFGEPDYITAVWLAQEKDPARGDVVLFEGVPPGRYAVVLDHGRQIESVRVREGETLEVTLGGAGATELRGRIQRAGQPITNAEVAAAPASGDILSARESRVDEAGRFALIGIRPGRVLFRVAERETQRTWFAAVDFFSAPDEEVVLSAPEGVLEIQLAPTAEVLPKEARVRIRIEVLDGVDLRGSVPATYRIVGEYAWGEGAVLEVDGLAAGQYQVEIEAGERVLRGVALLRESFARITLPQ